MQNYDNLHETGEEIRNKPIKEACCSLLLCELVRDSATENLDISKISSIRMTEPLDMMSIKIGQQRARDRQRVRQKASERERERQGQREKRAINVRHFN